MPFSPNVSSDSSKGHLTSPDLPPRGCHSQKWPPIDDLLKKVRCTYNGILLGNKKE